MPTNKENDFQADVVAFFSDGDDLFVADDFSFGISVILDGGAGINTIDYSQVELDDAYIVADGHGTFQKRFGEVAVNLDFLRHVANIIGTKNSDIIIGDGGANQLTGGGGDDSLSGAAGNDTLFGGVGDDSLSGGTGTDYLQGGSGNDVLFQDNYFDNDTIAGDEGKDTLDYTRVEVSRLSNWNIVADLGNASVLKYYIGGAVATDTVFSIENIIATKNHDRILGSEFANALSGMAGQDTLSGLGGNDLLDGGAGADLLSGGEGDDSLNGGTGQDSMSGGSGNDLFLQYAASHVGGIYNDTINGDEDIDTIDYSDSKSVAPVPVAIVANLMKHTVTKTVFGNVGGTDTLTNIENVIAGQYNDTIIGDGNANVLTGGGGSDLIQSGAGNDTILQNRLFGEDTVDGGSGIDTIDYSGLQLDDGAITGISADLFAKSVTKYQNGGAFGRDSISNVEMLVGTRYSDVMSADSNANLLSGGGGDDCLNGRAGNDTLIGGLGTDQVSGENGDDLIVQDSFEGDDNLDGGAGIDTADYSRSAQAGDNIKVRLASFSVEKFHADNLAQSIGHDVIVDVENIIGGSGDDDIAGNQMSNALAGGAGQDSLSGADGRDTLSGGTGDDVLSGGAASDLVVGEDGDDHIIQDAWGGYDTINGGTGLDSLDYSQCMSPGRSFSFDITTGVLSKYQDGAIVGVDVISGIETILMAPGDDIVISDAAGNVIFMGDGNNNVYGVEGNDTLGGGAGNDMLSGGNGSDQIVGDAGDDVFLQDGMLGDDTLDGGTGIDTVDYRQGIGAGISVDISSGPGYGYKLQDGVVLGMDFYRDIERFTGTRNGDVMRGASLADFFSGDAGNDALNGNDGNDTLNGGLGNDDVSGDNGNDLLVQDTLYGNDTLDGGTGFDVVDYRQVLATSGASAAIRANLATGSIEKLQNGAVLGRDSLIAIEGITGSHYDDTLAGSAKNDRINGDAGDDSLSGLDGSDYLDGGEANDILSGGAGSNTLMGGAGNDRFVQDTVTASDYIDGGPGIDTIDYSGINIAKGSTGGVDVNLDSDFAGFGFVKKFLNGATIGSDEVSNIDAVIGTAFNDKFSGDETSDLMRGEAGDDRFVQGMRSGDDTLDGGAGVDTVEYTEYFAGARGVQVDLAAGSVIKYDDGAVAGTDRLFSIERVIGSKQNDTISGTSISDTLYAVDGDDLFIATHWLDKDTLDGGSGQDIVDYSVNLANGSNVMANLSTGKVIKFFNGVTGGSDTLNNIEGVIGSRSGDTLIGSAAADTLDGNAGNDLLSGAGGNDTLFGGDGDDIIMQDNLIGDAIIDGGAGMNTLDYSQTPVMDARVKVNLASGYATKYHGNTDVGTDVISHVSQVIGTNNNDTMTGSASTDLLTGGRGDDLLSAGQGNDTLLGQDGNDTLIFDSLNGEHVIDGGVGTDTLDFSPALHDGFSIRFVAATGILTKLDHGVNLGEDLILNVETVIADHSGYKNVLNASAAGAILLGGAGDQSFTENLLSTNDTIYGGDGFDTLDYSGVQINVGMTGAITVDLGSSSVTKTLNRDYFQPAIVGTDSVSKIEAFIGTGFNDRFLGDREANVFYGAGGGDSMEGGAGDDVLDGGADGDILRGGLGNDTIIGNSGNDFIGDDGGSNLFVFADGFGKDRLVNGSASSRADVDIVRFEHIDAANIFFKRNGDDLIVTVADKTDELTVAGWYGINGDSSGRIQFHIDQFQAGDFVVSSTAIDQFVTISGMPPIAMSSLMG